MTSAPKLVVEFCGEGHELDSAREFTVGRDADLVVDENPYLHRRFLQVAFQGGLWWVSNIGSQLSATVSDADGRMQAWLAPGASLPIVFATTSVRFTAGPTTYEIALFAAEPAFLEHAITEEADGSTTIGATTLTLDQRRLVVALAEPLLSRSGSGRSDLPSTSEAAERLRWTSTKFNRKLDNVCQKLERLGVRGLHGGPDRLASNRRARLVEYAIASRLVTQADLPLLESQVDGAAGEEV